MNRSATDQIALINLTAGAGLLGLDLRCFLRADAL